MKRNSQSQQEGKKGQCSSLDFGTFARGMEIFED